MTLRIYPKHPTADDTYFIDGAWAPAAITARDKRFSEAELCAEYWNATYFIAGAQFNEVSSQEPYPEQFWDRNYERANTIYRFATLPHHDQETA